MRKAYWACLLVGLLLVTPACVKLTGQRIVWSYDEAKDEIQILLFYDGIHDSGDNQHGKGVDQISRFVAEGNFMLGDWFLHFDRKQLQKQVGEGATPLDRDCAKLLLNIRVETIGRYREPDGRIGGVQRLTIPKAKDFLARLNGLINRAIVDTNPPAHPSMPRTVQRIDEAAKAGHAWLTLDGQSLRVTVPVDRHEWNAAKTQFLQDAIVKIAAVLGEKGRDDDRRMMRALIGCLAAAPVSYLDEGKQFHLIIGRRDGPMSLRPQLVDPYEASLEKAVESSVPADFDKAVAQSLLGGTAPPLPAVLLVEVPEVSVGALLRWAKAGDEEQKAAVARRLETWAEQWNRERTAPKAPGPNRSRDEYFAAWEKWYAQMKQFPLVEPEGKAERRNNPDKS